MNCNKECSTCASSCGQKCPICGKNGLKVIHDAVLNIVKEPKYIDLNKQIYICQNKKCEVTYFQEENPKYYTKEELKVPIWFKEKYQKYLVCYCYNIYIDDIVKIISEEKEKLSIDDIKHHFTKVHDDCKICHPLGTPCDKVFENAIEFCYHQKERNNL